MSCTRSVRRRIRYSVLGALATLICLGGGIAESARAAHQHPQLDLPTVPLPTVQLPSVVATAVPTVSVGGGATVTPPGSGGTLPIPAPTDIGNSPVSTPIAVNATGTVHICGIVSALVSPTSVSAGSVTIGGQTLTLAPGATLGGAGASVGSPLCLDGSTNPQAQITNGTLTASAPTSLSLCGMVSAFTAPSNVQTGSITIAGQTLTLAPGATVSGAAATAGSDLCGTFTTNPQGQVSNGQLSASAPTSLNLCGILSGYAAPTNVQTGSLSIGGQALTLAPGATLNGAAAQIGSNVCAALTTNPQGQVVGGTISASAPTTASVCGLVSAYLPATSAAPGSVTIAGVQIVLPASYVPATPIAVGSSTCVTPTNGGGNGSGSGSGGTGSGSGSGGTGPGNGSNNTGNGSTGSGGSGSVSGTGTGSGSGSGTGSGSGSGTGSGTGSGSGSTGGTSGSATGQVAGTTASAAMTLTEYILPGAATGSTPASARSNGPGPWQFAWDRAGNLWFTEIRAGRLGELVAGTRTLRQFPLSSPKSKPYGLAVDAVGNIWVAESAGNRIDRVAPDGIHATLTMWKLPHSKSRPQGISLDAGGTVWVAEYAGRIARFTPATAMLREYSVGSTLHPRAVVIDTQGPTVANESGNSETRVQILAQGKLRLTTLRLPTAGGKPMQMAVSSRGTYVTEQKASALALLLHLGGKASTTAPDTRTLRGVTHRITATRSGLAIERHNLPGVQHAVTKRTTKHWAEWLLSSQPTRPFDVRVDPRGKRVWLSESGIDAIGQVVPGKNTMIEYTIPHSNAKLRGIEIRQVGGGVKVWIAEYGLDRLAVLSAK